MLTYILLGVAIVLAVCFIVFHSPKRPVLSLVLKCVASLAVTVTAFVGFSEMLVNQPGIHNSSMLICFGLIACLAGDAILALLEFGKEHLTNKIRIFGIGAFSVAQVLFFMYFVFAMGETAWFALIVGAVLTLCVLLVGQLMGLKYGKLIIPVAIYSFLIGTVLGASVINIVLYSYFDITIFLLVGMILFFVSDLVLSLIYFGESKIRRALYYPNYILYFAAIIAIAAGLVFA